MNELDVYRNLRLHPRAWSVREGGRISRYVREITLMDVRFVVHPAAVCAYARGIPCDAPRYPSAVRVRFDPFEAAAFMTENGFPVLRASLAHFMENGECWCVL